MSKFRYDGNPHKVMEFYIDNHRFRTKDGIIEVPDAIDERMEKNSQFIKLGSEETKKTTKAKKAELKDEYDG